MVTNPNGNFIKWNNDNKDFYETVNTFSGNKKRSDKIFELMNLYLDIDFKLSNINVDINDEQQIYNYIDLIVGRCRELKIPDPSQINFSGNGLHVYWFVDKVNDFNNEGKKLFGSNAKACKKFYLNLEKELVKKFQDLGADNNAKDLSRVLRVVGTSNSKNGKVCKSIYLDDKTYKLDEFAHLLKYNYDEYQEFVNQPTTDKQLELAKVLDIKVSDKKLVAHQQIAKAIQSSKADDNKSKKLNRNIEFILDEFANITKIKDIDTKVSVCLGRGIRFNMIVQNEEQLDEVYGENTKHTIKSNALHQIFLGGNDIKACKDFSDGIGNTTKLIENDQIGSGNMLDWKEESIPLITPEELAEIKLGTTVHKIKSCPPIKASSIPSFTYQGNYKKTSPEEFYGQLSDDQAPHIKADEKDLLFDRVLNPFNDQPLVEKPKAGEGPSGE